MSKSSLTLDDKYQPGLSIAVAILGTNKKDLIESIVEDINKTPEKYRKFVKQKIKK